MHTLYYKDLVFSEIDGFSSFKRGEARFSKPNDHERLSLFPFLTTV